MKKEIEEFLMDASNIDDIDNRSEADFQFELGYFLKNNKHIHNLRFEYQFKDLYKDKTKNILKKEADICVLGNDKKSVKFCVEIKLLKQSAGSTNFFRACFKDICYLLQLKEEKQIKSGYFVLICANTEFIRKDTKSEKAKFWRGNNLIELRKYNKDFLPKNSFEKLKEFIEKDNWSLYLKTKTLEYKFISSEVVSTKNSEYAYCIVEI